MNQREITKKNRNEIPLVSHLTELRKRLIISIISILAGFFIALLLYNYIIEFLFKPLLVLSPSVDGNRLFVNTIFEGFIVRLKISVLVGIIISFPVHLFNLVRFVYPGLKKNERQIITIALMSSFMFIIISFFYSYYNIIPLTITVLTGSGFIPENTGMLLNFAGNIFYILQFMIMALVVFQIPILMEILLVLGILKRKALLRKGKYIIIVFFILAALITPPDFVTQIGLALPMTLLYYLTILIARIFKFGEE